MGGSPLRCSPTRSRRSRTSSTSSSLVYILLIFAYILTSWIRLPYSLWLNRIQRFLYDVCEPYLRIFRRILPPFGPLDLSPIVADLLPLLIVLADRVPPRPAPLRREVTWPSHPSKSATSSSDGLLGLPPRDGRPATRGDRRELRGGVARAGGLRGQDRASRDGAPALPRARDPAPQDPGLRGAERPGAARRRGARRSWSSSEAHAEARRITRGRSRSASTCAARRAGSGAPALGARDRRRSGRRGRPRPSRPPEPDED